VAKNIGYVKEFLQLKRRGNMHYGQSSFFVLNKVGCWIFVDPTVSHARFSSNSQ
jgi:hypothetical protein